MKYVLNLPQNVWLAADQATTKVALCGHRTDVWTFSRQRRLEGRCASQHRRHDDSASDVPEFACWPRKAATSSAISHTRLQRVGLSRLQREVHQMAGRLSTTQTQVSPSPSVFVYNIWLLCWDLWCSGAPVQERETIYMLACLCHMAHQRGRCILQTTTSVIQVVISSWPLWWL